MLTYSTWFSWKWVFYCVLLCVFNNRVSKCKQHILHIHIYIICTWIYVSHTWIHTIYIYIYINIILAFSFLLSIVYKLASSRKRTFSWENSSIRLACGQVCRTFSCFLTEKWGEEQFPVRGVTHGQEVMDSIKKASWAWHGEKASKERLSMVPEISSCFKVLVLKSYPHFSSWWATIVRW